MTTMNDDQLDATLVRFLDAQAQVIAARARGERTAAEAMRPRIMVRSTRRTWMLLAAAILLAGAAAVGLSAGAATLRELPTILPTPPTLQALPASTHLPSDASDEIQDRGPGCPWRDTWARPMISRTQFVEHCRR
jgi:hypothetical protein